MKSISNRLLAMMVVILVIGTLGLLARQFGSLEWLVKNEILLRQWVQQQPWRGWIFGLLIYTAFSLVPGTAGKSVICGWLFGFWQAVLMVDIGLSIAALAGFLAARFIVRDAVEARWRRRIGQFNDHLERDGAFFLLMMRLAHVPYSLVNYCAGVTSIPVRTFFWTTSLGVVPGTVIFVFVGTRIPTLATLAEQGIWKLFDPLFVGILAATVVFPLLIRWSIRQYRKRSGTPMDVEMLELDSIDTWKVEGRTNGAH